MSVWLSNDYEDVKHQLKARFGFVPDAKEEPLLSQVHKCVFCVASLGYELSKLDNDRMDFMKEVTSDFIHLLVFFPLGFKKPFFLAIRSGIEHVLMHIYYRDHPIELLLLEESPDNQLTTKQFFSYVKEHPRMKKIAGFQRLIDLIHEEYKQNSKMVHGTSYKYMQLNKTIAEIKLTDEEKGELLLIMERLTNYLLTVLFTFHKKDFHNIDAEKRKIIMSCVTADNQKIIHDL